MGTETIKIFTFDELTESAKDAAIEELCDLNVDHNWYEFVFDDAKMIGELLGIEIENIYFSGFSSQGDGACFTGSYSYAQKALKKVLEHCPNETEVHRIARELQSLQRKAFYSLSASVSHRGHYYHEMCTSIDVSDKWSDYGSNFDDELSELLRDFMRWINESLEKEYDHLTSREAIIESIKANEYTFTESGEMT